MDSESKLTCLKCGCTEFEITVGVDDNVQVLMSHCIKCKCIMIFSTCIIASTIKKDETTEDNNKGVDALPSQGAVAPYATDKVIEEAIQKENKNIDKCLKNAVEGTIQKSKCSCCKGSGAISYQGVSVCCSKCKGEGKL